MSNILVLSYETDLSNNINAQLFRNTLEMYNWNYKFIGDNTPWKGFKDKIIGCYTYLCENTDDNTIVVLSDSRDVFCCRTPQFFIDKISDKIDRQIIVSAELFLHGHIEWTKEKQSKVLHENPHFFWQGIPLDNYWSYYNISNDQLPLRKYVNAGLIIGKSCNLKMALKWILDNNYTDDQLGMSNYTNIFPDRVYLDCSASILHTSTGCVNGCLYDYYIQKQDLPSFDELFGLSAYFLHLPGIAISKGQQILYKSISNLYNNSLGKSAFDLYNLNPSNPIHTNYFYK
ncbi:MAG: hypothetical protein ACOVRN_01690 [Flavobacterium sp.]